MCARAEGCADRAFLLSVGCGTTSPQIGRVRGRGSVDVFYTRLPYREHLQKFRSGASENMKLNRVKLHDLTFAQRS